MQTDAVRVRGVELELKGNLTRELELVAGYSHLDPRVNKSIAGYAGKYMISTALDQGSIWGKYTWYDGPLAGLGWAPAFAMSVKPTATTSTLSSCPLTRWLDAAISYDFAYTRREWKGLNAQVNVTNLTNHFYVASCFTGLPYCGLGNARTVLGTLKYNWN